MPVMSLRRATAMTPERQRLAEAIAAHREAEAAHAALVAACDFDGPASTAITQANEALNAAQAALEQAKQDAAAALVAAAMGAPNVPTMTAKKAREAVANGEDDLAAAIAVRDTLRGRIAPAAKAVERAAWRVDGCVRAVLLAEAPIAALLAELDGHYRKITDLGRALCVLTGPNGIPRNGPDAYPEASYVWSLLTQPPMNWVMWQTLSPSAVAWETAMAALMTDATTPLPAVTG